MEILTKLPKWKSLIYRMALSFASFLTPLYQAYLKSMTIQVSREDRSFKSRLGKGPAIFVFWCSKTFPLTPLTYGADLKHLTFFDLKHAFLQRVIGLNEETKLYFSTARQSVFDMVRHLRNGSSVSLIADGPYGPSGQIKDGALQIARRTRVPIIPVTVEMEKSFRIPWRWDRYEIAFPFSRIRISFNDPIEVQDNPDPAKKRIHDCLGTP